MRSGIFVLFARLLFMVGAFESVQSASATSLAPDTAFVQWGGSGHLEAVAAGAGWNTGWSPFGERSGVQVETSLSRWIARGVTAPDHGTLWQLGLIPALRYRLGGSGSLWFGEVGIGATVTSRLYQSSNTRFATAFNFGDHVALGRSFGADARYELAVRIEHFSNGGIKEPNPGKNFYQLRFVRHFE